MKYKNNLTELAFCTIYIDSNNLSFIHYNNLKQIHTKTESKYINKRESSSEVGNKKIYVNQCEKLVYSLLKFELNLCVVVRYNNPVTYVNVCLLLKL